MSIISDQRFRDIAEAAIAAKGMSQTQNPTDMAKALRFEIAYIPMREDLPAFVIYESRTVTIYINSRVDKYSQQLLCAHELGHYLLGHSDSGVSLFDADINPMEEFEANLFAYGVFPKAFVRAQRDAFETYEDFNLFVSSLIHYKKDI